MRWTIEHVEFLIEHRIHERADLEFKQSLPAVEDLTPWLGAMANTCGGSVVFGVEEDTHGRAVRPSEPRVPLEGATAFVERAARSVDEPVVVECVEIQDRRAPDGRGFLVVDVEASQRAPHLVDGIAWLRVDQGIRRMRRAELARSFAQADGFMDESGLTAAMRRPADIVADIQRLGADRVLMFRNVGDRPAFGVRWSHLGSRGIVMKPVDDPFPVEVMRPKAVYAVRAAFASAELPAKVEVSWRDDRDLPRQTLVVVT
jgi:hypothetical protein